MKSFPALVFIFALLATSSFAQSAADSAVALERAGKNPEAYAAFLSLAETGDAKAMLDVGRFNYEGRGVPKNYTLAMDWWVKAFEKDEGMAYNNIAVLYRDGLGVEKNLKIAWGLLFIGHMRGLGGQDTVSRINGNLRKVVSLIPPADVNEASRWSEEYFKEFVKKRGADAKQYEALKHSPKYPPVIALATY